MDVATQPLMIPRALTIAGSDSGGGAGIQQDIRVFTALGVFASSVITALTAQNSLGVQAVEPVEPVFIEKQLSAVMEDIRPVFIKTGMLLNAPVVRAVHTVLSQFPDVVLVIDTVMLSKNRTVLLDADGVKAMKELLFPRATLITPNIPEAEELLDTTILTTDDMKEAARSLQKMAGRNVSGLLKGGHLPGDKVVDCLLHADHFQLFPGKRILTRHTHGTGCTLSSAVTALLSRGFPMDSACFHAVELTKIAIKNAVPTGMGTGPLNVFSWHGDKMPVSGHESGWQR